MAWYRSCARVFRLCARLQLETCSLPRTLVGLCRTPCRTLFWREKKKCRRRWMADAGEARARRRGEGEEDGAPKLGEGHETQRRERAKK